MTVSRVEEQQTSGHYITFAAVNATQPPKPSAAGSETFMRAEQGITGAPGTSQKSETLMRVK